MERYYIWAKNYRKSFTEIMVSYIGGYLASILMSSENGTFIDRIHLLQKVNYINVLSWLAIIVFTIYLCSIKVIGIYLERNNLYTKFSNYIKQNTDPCRECRLFIIWAKYGFTAMSKFIRRLADI